MPVRSFNMKLVVPRDDDGRATRDALWTTHREVNTAVAYYEARLLLARGLPYDVVKDGQPTTITAGAVQSAALAMARTAQAANQRRLAEPEEALGRDAEVLAALRTLYTLLIPDETGEGSAQAANAYISPLTDPHSQGFGGTAEKLTRPRPNWTDLPDDAELLDAATAWFASEASASWRGDTGSPAGWLRAARAGKPDWPKLFREKLDDLQDRAATGPEATISQLRRLRLLPLFEPYFPPRMATTGGVTPWDRASRSGWLHRTCCRGRHGAAAPLSNSGFGRVPWKTSGQR